MNQRIKEFIDKANGYWEHGDFNMPKTVCFSEHDIELFAELIVAECTKILADNSEFRGCVIISKHFGVEE